MDGAVITEIAGLSRKPFELAGFLYRPDDWLVEDPASLVKAGPVAKALEVSSLGALRDYVKANRDGLVLDKLIAYVAGPSSVWVGGALEGRSRVREYYIQAKALDLADGFIGSFHSVEQFIIGMQTRFVDSYVRTNVLRLLSNIKHEAVKTSQDDGVSQTVQSRIGVVLVQDVAVPNPVLLTAYRTFREVTQASSIYTLRVNSSNTGVATIGLFEADGGAWRLTAVDRVRDWLVEALPSNVAIIA